MGAAKEDGFEDLFNAMTLIDFEIGSQFYAKPSLLVDPHNFFLMPFPFIYHLPALNKAGAPLCPEELKENMTVIFTSNKPDINKYFKIELDQNIRGIIQKIDEDSNCEIFAIDYGFIEENVNFQRIFRPVHQEAIAMPSLIQHCELDICAPKGPNFSDDAIEAFKFYIGNEKLSVVIRGRNSHKLKVVVYNSNPDDVATLLALTHYTYLSINIREDWNVMTVKLPRRRPKLTFQHMELNIGETYTVRVQSGSSLKSFYVTPMSTYNDYVKNRADFTNYCRSMPEIGPMDFTIGTVVGVQSDVSHFYERAVIIDKSDSKAKVKLVDWGTEMEVSKSRVKAIKTKLFTMSPAALYCSADEGFQPWDNGLPQFLYKGYSFAITVKGLGNGFESPHIVSLTPT